MASAIASGQPERHGSLGAPWSASGARGVRDLLRELPKIHRRGAKDTKIEK
ncbi:MAG: hypothetical protein LBI02_06580 [Opitutaceae bacterium]|jgi:hypothetical protein|nr:hypothetical protein [Opitutaceae bacterium]